MEKASSPKEAKAVDLQELSQEQLSVIVEKADQIDTSESKTPTLDKRSMLGEELGFPAAHNLSNQEVDAFVDSARTRSEELIHEAKRSEFSHIVEAAEKANSIADLRTALSEKYGFRKIYEMNNLELKAFVADARKKLKELDQPDKAGTEPSAEAPVTTTEPQPVDVPHESQSAEVPAPEATPAGESRTSGVHIGEEVVQPKEPVATEAPTQEIPTPKPEEEESKKPEAETTLLGGREAATFTVDEVEDLLDLRETVEARVAAQKERLASQLRESGESGVDEEYLRERAVSKIIRKSSGDKKVLLEALKLSTDAFNKLFESQLKKLGRLPLTPEEAKKREPADYNIEEVWDIVDFRKEVEAELQKKKTREELGRRIEAERRQTFARNVPGLGLEEQIRHAAQQKLREEIVKRLKDSLDPADATNLNLDHWAMASDEEFSKAFTDQLKMIKETREEIEKEAQQAEKEKAERKEERKKRWARRFGLFALSNLKWDKKSGTYLMRDNLLK
ncbi:MAG: hypothetical protein ACREGJ_00320 [Candidatus Saccharimonadales bacterium]